MSPGVGDLVTLVSLTQFGGGLIPRGTRVEVFQQIFWVFLALGTLVGAVVVGYMLYTGYKYRDDESRSAEIDPPTPGELPTGSGGGRKLFFSFGLSTVIVVSLIIWTYGTLLYVEQEPPGDGEEDLEVEVVGFQFGWEFVYPNGNTTDTLRVPRGETVHLKVTSEDVFHTFGVPELRVKTDAIPGQTTDTWFVGNETGTYEARCFELCGAGHSFMLAEVEVMAPEEFESWYANTTAESENTTDESENTTAESDGSESESLATASDSLPVDSGVPNAAEVAA